MSFTCHQLFMAGTTAPFMTPPPDAFDASGSMFGAPFCISDCRSHTQVEVDGPLASWRRSGSNSDAHRADQYREAGFEGGELPAWHQSWTNYGSSQATHLPSPTHDSTIPPPT